MSAIGPKQTCARALHMSAFGGKADMTICGNPLSRSLLGAKRTCRFALHMSANDPKQTSSSRSAPRARPHIRPLKCARLGGYDALSSASEEANETARVHHPYACRRRGGCGVFCCARSDSEGTTSHRRIPNGYANST